MTALAPTASGLFQRSVAVPATPAPTPWPATATRIRLLLAFIHEKAGTPPARLKLTQLDAPTIAAFLEHLECERGKHRTRNIRLAAVRSSFSTARCASPSTPR
jgi:integrase/recombinase XerD